MLITRQEQHLKNMLKSDLVIKEDKSAIRFALWVIGRYKKDRQQVLKLTAPAPVTFQITDTRKGRVMYECLYCRKSWEATDPRDQWKAKYATACYPFLVCCPKCTVQRK